MSDTVLFMYNSIEKAQGEAVAFLVPLLQKGLVDMWLHYKWFIIIFVVLFLFSKYLDRGIGSVYYNTVYFTLLVIALKIFGLDLIFNAYFDIICFCIYIFSYRITGLFYHLRHSRVY